MRVGYPSSVGGEPRQGAVSFVIGNTAAQESPSGRLTFRAAITPETKDRSGGDTAGAVGNYNQVDAQQEQFWRGGDAARRKQRT